MKESKLLSPSILLKHCQLMHGINEAKFAEIILSKLRSIYDVVYDTALKNFGKIKDCLKWKERNDLLTHQRLGGRKRPFSQKLS